MTKRNNHVQDNIEKCLHNAIEKARHQEPRGFLVLYFPELGQSEAEDLVESIEVILEAELGIKVHVDI